MRKLRSQTGSSLLELIVAMTIIGILATLVSGFYVDRLMDYARTNTLIILQTNTKQALESMQKDIRSARTVEETNEWADANGPNGNQNGWTSTSGSPSVLVLSVPTTDASGNLQYGDTAHNVLLTNDVIYYVDSSRKTLYRRVLVNDICLPEQGGAGAVNCSDRNTCPPTSATSSCPADGKVIEDVANLVVQYYDSTNTATNDVNIAYSVETTLTQSRARFGKTYSNSLSSRTTLRNKP